MKLCNACSLCIPVKKKIKNNEDLNGMFYSQCAHNAKYYHEELQTLTASRSYAWYPYKKKNPIYHEMILTENIPSN